MRSDAERLNDILEAISKIRSRIVNNVEVFLADEMAQVWAVHHLQTIGEAARCLSEEFRSAHPQIPWPQIIALRNILVHEYFGLNLQQVWMMVQRDLPALEREVRSIHSQSDPPSEA
jgi:uncharacterized protein with HEPN domain